MSNVVCGRPNLTACVALHYPRHVFDYWQLHHIIPLHSVHVLSKKCCYTNMFSWVKKGFTACLNNPHSYLQ